VPGRSSEEAERELRDLPDLKLLGLLHSASNYTFLARLGPLGRSGLRAVYKPAKGESPLWDFEAGTLYKREVAAYELSKALGWPDIPPTVVRRKAPHGVGALQLFIEADGRHFFGESGKHTATWIRVALFDVLTNNADRKSGHCLFDADGKVWVIDHGLTFHVDPKLRTVIWDFAGDPLPDDLCGDVERVLLELEKGTLARTMQDLINDHEMKVLTRRFRGVLDRRWRFPEPSSAWSIPWPPV
jgi:hypothetical protein